MKLLLSAILLWTSSSWAVEPFQFFHCIEQTTSSSAEHFLVDVRTEGAYKLFETKAQRLESLWNIRDWKLVTTAMSLGNNPDVDVQWTTSNADLEFLMNISDNEGHLMRGQIRHGHSVASIDCLDAAFKKPKILMVLNEGYRPEEYWTPRKRFDQSGFEIKIAGHYPGVILPSKAHLSEVPPVPVDLTFEQVSVSDFDAVVFVGGNGAWNDFLPNSKVHKILLDSFRQHKVTALICAATGLLATAGNLDGEHPLFKGHHVTGYFEVEGLLKKVGQLDYDSGDAEKPFVVVDGNLITARDPLSAQAFGETVVEELGLDKPIATALKK
jgi:protease I